MKPMNEQHLAILRRHMVEVIGIHFDLASEEIGAGAGGKCSSLRLSEEDLRLDPRPGK